MPEPEAPTPESPEAAPAVEPAPPTPPAEDWETRFKYLLADFENFRRRVDRERDQARRTGRLRVLRGLLPLGEAIERADESVRSLPSKDPVRAGLKLLVEEWHRFLEAERIERVARPGAPFRAEEHEAVGEVPASEDRPDGTIGEVVQQGYRCDDGLLRPAKVIVAHRPLSVATGPGKGEAADPPEEG